MDFREEIVLVGKRMYDRGFIASNDGNISFRIDEDSVLITPTGVSKGFMHTDDLIITDMEGQIIKGNKKCSSETNMHLQIYKSRPDVKSVCHAHPPYATGFAVAGIALDQMALPEVIITLGAVPLVEYGTTGTEELYNMISKYVKDYDAYLLANHGVVAVGSSINGAYHRLETIEHAAKITFIARQLGNINSLGRNEIEKLIDARGNFGIRKNLGNVSDK